MTRQDLPTQQWPLYSMGWQSLKTSASSPGLEEARASRADRRAYSLHRFTCGKITCVRTFAAALLVASGLAITAVPARVLQIIVTQVDKNPNGPQPTTSPSRRKKAKAYHWASRKRQLIS
jgi:hypothetical protein